MPETLALFRYAIDRHKLSIIVMLSIAVLGETSALAFAAFSSGTEGFSVALVTLVLTMLPATFCALIFFDYGQSQDLVSAQSGCEGWLLRQPIHAWKIALPPILLKTTWISCTWVLFALTLPRFIGDSSVIPVVGPCICFSAAAIWTLVITWLPVRNSWSRLGMLAIAIPSLCALISCTFVTAQPDLVAWKPLTTAVAIFAYVTGVFITVRSVQMAKVSSLGLIAEQGPWVKRSAAGPLEPRRFASDVRALIWHDLASTRVLIRYVLLLAVIPSVLILVFWVPLTGPSLAMALILFVYLGVLASSRIGVHVSKGVLPALFPYIAVSPLKTSTIAWTRLLTIVGVTLAVWSGFLLVLLGWSLWPENRDNWYQWATMRAGELGPAADPLWVGAGWSIAIALATTVLVMGRLVSMLWISLLGRTWVNMLACIVVYLLLAVVLGVFLRWFLQQTDWESTTATMLRWLEMVPAILVGLLLVKTIATAMASYALIQRQLASMQEITCVFLIWTTLTVTIGITLAALIPHPQATLGWCLAATAAAIPLARTLILPVSLSLDRHR
ncbi:MAG: hypothetical protein MI861_08435 [Pirellulales bacterium]|nr:hypothetical protein [Pirellulales bacterium]